MNAPHDSLRVSVNGVTRTFPGDGPITVGRTPDNDVIVVHPLVSRHHMTIERRPNGWTAVDQGSTNGIYLGGRRVPTAVLPAPAEFRLGDPSTGPLLHVTSGAAPAPGGPGRFASPGPAPRRPGPPGPGRPPTGRLQAPGPVGPPPAMTSPIGGPPSGRFPQPPMPGATLPPEARNAPHLAALAQNASAVFATARPNQPREIAVGGQTLTIGRTPENDIVVSDVLASRRHARIVGAPNGNVIEDLGSINGTYVNGARVRSHLLAEGDVVTIGNSDFVVHGGMLVRGQDREVAAGGLHAMGIDLVVEGKKKLLQSIDVEARPGSLTAVIGPSGAGKSTVSKIIAGLARPTGGQVLFEGRDVHAEYDALRSRIGMVPQDDVLHRSLTLEQALGYAAELRLPPDTSKEDRKQVIDGVLAELQLTEHLTTRVDRLSGGQRKRASVAMELLTGPSLLILDEPTSGLDPALDRQVMQTLRRLADAGRVVLVVTHSLSYLSLCDQVLLLAPGGKTAYLGSPRGVRSAMGTDDWAEIFAYVAESPDAAHAEFHRRGGVGGRFGQPPPPGAPSAVSVPPPTSLFRQFSTIARRQWRLVLSDRGYLAFLLILPIVLGALTLVVPGDHGLTGRGGGSGLRELKFILVILVVGTCFTGATLTVRDLVGERPIFERERAVGLRPAAYMAAKTAVYFVIGVLQVAIILGITVAAKPRPEKGVFVDGTVELFLTLSLLVCVSALLGLAISAIAKSNEQVMPPLVVLVMIQLVFSGGLFGLVGKPGLEQASWAFPAHWSFAATAATTDFNQREKDFAAYNAIRGSKIVQEEEWDIRKQAEARGLEVPESEEAGEQDPMWDKTATAFGIDTGVILLMGLVIAGFTYSRLRLRKR